MKTRRNIGAALNELIDERRRIPTEPDRLVLGKMVESEGNQIAIDIGDILVLSGMNLLAESMIRAIIEQSVFSRSDVMIEQRTDADRQPELFAAGVTNVVFYARLSVLEDLPRFYQLIGYHIRYMFNAIQSRDLFERLIPPSGEPPRGILFPFHRGKGSDSSGFFYLIEYVPTGQFLRLTLESETDSRLRMNRIPHQVVDGIGLVHARVDIADTAAVVLRGIQDVCLRQGRQYVAARLQIDAFISFLQEAGIGDIEVIAFFWQADFCRHVLSTKQTGLHARIVRIFAVLGDSTLIAHLLASRSVRLEDGDRCCHVDLSQRNRCLNISFEVERIRLGLPEQLQRMPAVHHTAASHPTNRFENVDILLVHHLTAEVLGFIQALSEMGARRIDTLWVRYAGVVEPAYKEIILSLPEAIYRFFGLTPVLDEDGLQNRFLLSDEYSSTDGLGDLRLLLQSGSMRFFEAMRSAAGHLFLEGIRNARKNGGLFCVIEDGGYIAPIVNQLCMERGSVREAAAFFRFPLEKLPEEELGFRFSEWLDPVFMGSVEHTRNGYEALERVEKSWGRLAFPAVSIAVSDFKIHRESRDVAYSCLNAVENVMNAMGFTFSDRTALVLGARGAIGGKSMRILSDRIGAGRLYGVDIAKPDPSSRWRWFRDIDSIPDDIMASIDMIFGIIGTSICHRKWIERLLLKTRKSHVFWASGSTKTAEFSELTDWLSDGIRSRGSSIGGMELSLSVSEIEDPKTRTLQGRTVRLGFGGKQVYFHLLAGLMPVNFLYYGVPSETMNHVMNELLQMSALLATRHKSADVLPPRLLALDRHISIEGAFL